MAIDGSFCIQYELERFLLRCPKLAAAPQLAELAKKGKNVTEDELVDGVAELLLHPMYTIPVVGCFRPVARKIVDRVVAMLHLVPDLTSDSNHPIDVEATLFDGEEVVCGVIDLYVKHGRGLRLHELSCLAFSRTLDLVSDLVGSVRDYFKFAPPPFKRIIGKESMSQLLVMQGAPLLNAMRVSYRLLLAEPDFFSRLWDWSCFLGLVQEITGFDGGKSKVLMDIRWCGVQILTVVSKMSDRMTLSDFGFDDEVAFECLLRWKEFLQDVSLEKAGWYLESFRESRLCSSKEDISLGRETPNLSCMDGIWDGGKNGRPFVLTSAVKKSFEMVWLAVSQRWPVLLYGPAGAGKTALISKLAHSQGSQGMLSSEFNWHEK